MPVSSTTTTPPDTNGVKIFNNNSSNDQTTQESPNNDGKNPVAGSTILEKVEKLNITNKEHTSELVDKIAGNNCIFERHISHETSFPRIFMRKE